MQSDHATRPIAAFNFDGPPETRSFWVGSLPHWEVLGRPIFVTLHVRGAIPFRAAARIRKLAAEIKDAKESEYEPRLQMIFKEMERWLDRTDRVSLLVQDAVADTLRDAIEKGRISVFVQVR